MFMSENLTPFGVVRNTKKGFHHGVIFWSHDRMDMTSIRRANLKRLADNLAPGDVTGFGKIIGKSQSATSDLLHGRKSFGEKMARSIEKNAGLNPLALDQPIEEGNATHGPDFKGRVPLISWVQAGSFCQIVDQFEPGYAEQWLMTVQDLGPNAYALRVQGDSMTAPYGRSYPDGVIIYVDPDAPITNGCRVIAKIPGAEEATFKVYVEDAGKKFLKPLNHQYPTIEMTPDMVICGVVRGAYMPE